MGINGAVIESFCHERVSFLTLCFGVFFSLTALALEVFVPEVESSAVSMGALYMFLSLRLYAAFCSSIVSKPRTVGAAFLVALLKLPILGLLLYVLARLGKNYAFGFLAGAFCFLPGVLAAVVWGGVGSDTRQLRY